MHVSGPECHPCLGPLPSAFAARLDPEPKPEWRGSGLLTRRHVARNHPGPPSRTLDQYRSGRTGRTLNPPASRPPQVRTPAWSSKLRVCTPTGRGSASRAHSVAVRIGPDAPIIFSRAQARRTSTRSVTHLVKRPVCRTGERDSISLRSANRPGRLAPRALLPILPPLSISTSSTSIWFLPPRFRLCSCA